MSPDLRRNLERVLLEHPRVPIVDLALQLGVPHPILRGVAVVLGERIIEQARRPAVLN